MAYLNPDQFGLAGLGCGGDCRCRGCRDAAPGGLAGIGCGSDCRCTECRSTVAGFGERYVPDDDDDDDDDEPAGPQPPPGPGRMRTGVAGLAGYGGPFGREPSGGGGGGAGPRVVFVPGIMGSRLVERTTGIPVWGDSRMIAALGGGPATIAAWHAVMTSGDGISRGGRVFASGYTNMPRIADPYTAIIADLNAAFGTANVLPFVYDWRLANETSAGALQAAIRARWPDAETSSERRVHIIAHSMGGLVSRWLIERLGGTRLVQSLVTVGTPHFGAPEALTMQSATTFGFLPGLPILGAMMVFRILANELALLSRGYGGVAQLLPSFDFVLPRGATAPEPISATFARIRSGLTWAPIFSGSILRGAASRSIRNLNRGLVGGLPALNAALSTAGTRYFNVAATNHSTVVQARVLLGPAISAVRAMCGDGTVPGSSAVLPAGSNITPLFRTSTLPHSDIFNDPAIRALSISLVRGTVPIAAPAPMCAAAAPRSGLEGYFGCARHEQMQALTNAGIR